MLSKSLKHLLPLPFMDHVYFMELSSISHQELHHLCNGTRLQVNHLGKNVISTTIITGKNVGDKIFIPRMDLVPLDLGLPFKFQRRQFHVSLCFAMTINKSQGQSLSRVGLYLPCPVFTHGRLYVAISRVKTKKGLKILILDEDGNITNTTKNVVYKEILKLFNKDKTIDMSLFISHYSSNLLNCSMAMLLIN